MHYSTDDYEEPHRKHGVVRTEYRNGSIVEGSWYGRVFVDDPDDRVVKHGLHRHIAGDLTYIHFYVFGVNILEMSFDTGFVEVSRLYGNFEFFIVQDLYGYNFAKERDDQAMLVRMMNSNPTATAKDVVTMWNRMIPLNIEVIESFYAATNHTEPLF